MKNTKKLVINKKSLVITDLFKHCLKAKNPVFHNELVKQICVKHGFGNPFDVTKLDSISKLPQILLENDFAIIHLGNGYHKFIKGIDKVYHYFEPIKTNVKWNYKKSLLNQYNSSESNILSVANNQRILHHFLFGKDIEFINKDIGKRSKTYFPHRTKTSFEYYFGKTEKVILTNIQIEVDLTIEYDGLIGVFEGKNGKPTDFSIYQLYHPFLYYQEANKSKVINGKIKKVVCVFVVRDKVGGNDVLNLWSYTFVRPYDITSIKFIKSASYQLISENNG